MTGVRGYPRPQLQRAEWSSLNGPWDFVIDADARWNEPAEIAWTGKIVVPFSPETPASGIGDTGFYRACWYRRTFDRPRLRPGERLMLHFGAVDHAATVWLNGEIVVQHEGGYTPFSADVTRQLRRSGPQTIVVHAEDDPHDLAKPRGKQDWQLDPHVIWYPRTTGIWQSVWMERLPTPAIASLRWTSNLDRWEIGLDAEIDGSAVADERLRLRVRLYVGDWILADDTYQVIEGEVHRRIALSDPGVDDYRNLLLWSPSCPTLIQAEIQLLDERGAVIDAVNSYTALRTFAIEGDRFALNGVLYPLRMVLDQGYWPDTGLTAPDDDALRADVRLAKEMGFNGVRKHQKIEDPRYLHWADREGLLVWEELPSAYRFTKRSVDRSIRLWQEAIDRDLSHPCIIVRVPLNESTGVPNLRAAPGQRDYVHALYRLTKTLDPDRPVDGNDGWESVATDIIGIHDYDRDLDRLARRYASEENVDRLITRERPGGRLLALEGHPHAGLPIMLSEFGGAALSDDPDASWGYVRFGDADELAEWYERIIEVVRTRPILAGFCYTQFADTYQEKNGLLYADRRPKFPLDRIADATRGPRSQHDEADEERRRERASALETYWDATVPNDLSFSPESEQ